jgi:NAD(P)H-flavin reductase/ferredoxin
MIWFLSPRRPALARVNDAIDVEVGPAETLLQAALRDGLDFPHSCRVGGCGTCKCRLVAGRVRELTDFGYVLTRGEREQGVILACQSVPRGDVRIDVELAPPPRAVRATIRAQRRLTHDIVQLDVEPEQALPFRDGQFVDLELDALPGQRRSYSFAAPPRPGAPLSFFVRKVAGGAFTGAVHGGPLEGQGLTLHGPAGDFWLRPGRAPLLLAAGGSGLAPILAMLEGGCDTDSDRPATLFFGARRQRDLYALDRIAALARAWRGGLDFVPVLSEEPPGSSWRGLRGLVTETLPARLPPATEAYLCGPPPMVDAMAERLHGLGLAAGQVRADRFTTLQHAAPVPA